MKTHTKTITAFLTLILTLTLITSCRNDLDYTVVTKDSLDNGGTDTAALFVNGSAFSYVDDDDSTDSVISVPAVTCNSHMAIHDGQIYYAGKTSLCRYDIKTGNITYVCPDPLCDHKTAECPFYGIDGSYGVYFSDSDILYKQSYSIIDKNGEASDVSRVVKYDTENDELTVLREINSDLIVSGMVVDGSSCFYIDTVYDEETNEYTFAFCRQNTDTLTTEIIESDEWKYSPMMSCGGKLYISDMMNSDLICRDVTTGEEYTVASNVGYKYKCDDGFIYSTENGGEVRVCDENGENNKSLGVNGVSYLYVTEKYIYYTLDMPKEIVFGDDGYRDGYREETGTVNISPIYRMDHDGTDVRKVFVPYREGDGSFYTLGSFIVSGRYIYSSFNRYTSAENDSGETVWSAGTSLNNNVMIRYDTETGDIYFIDFNSI